MVDVTDILMRYRECVRSIWNMHLVDRVDREGFDLVDGFASISSSLFELLVCDRLGVVLQRDDELGPPPYLRLIPAVDEKAGTPIHINRSSQASHGYWDYPVSYVNPSDVELQYLDLFDFDVRSFRDMQFYLCLVRASPTYPEIVGRKALIEPRNVKVQVME